MKFCFIALLILLYLIYGVFVPTNIIFNTYFGTKKFTILDLFLLVFFLPMTLFVIFILLITFILNQII